MNFYYLGLGIGLALVFVVTVASVLYKCDRARKRKKRKCECGCETVRHYQMIDDSWGYPPSPWGRVYRSLTLDRCTNVEKNETGKLKCGKVKCIKDVTKFYSLYKLAWRHFTNSIQFTQDEELLELAGMIEEAVQPLAERMKIAQEKMEKRSSLIDPPISPPVLLIQKPRHSATSILLASRYRGDKKPK